MAARLVALLLLLLAFSTNAEASRDSGTDPGLVIDKEIQHYVVEPDGSFTKTVDYTVTVAQQRAVQEHSQFYISYNKTLDEVLEVEAWNQKPDGRRVPVQPAQIRDQQETVSGDAPMFQDTRVKVVVFPEVAVRDQLVLHYVIRRHTPLFPGQFEDLSAPQFFQYKQFELVYDMPESMALYGDASGFVPMEASDPPGRIRYRWQYVGGDNQRIEADSVSYLDYGKRLAVSTFADYGSFARAFRGIASGKADGNETITALAREVTAGLANPRARALALSDWVRRNIRYARVYVGPGGVVPHPAATVLANRYGDCKDHAMLLEALLAAIGIESTGVLINNDSAYRLPRTPTLGIFNHMITYVPSLNLYLDSTAESIAAGYLPRSDLGKPVLLLKSGLLSATPARQAQRTRTSTVFEVQANGRSRFKVSKTTSGAMAEPYRQAVRRTRQADREQFVERMLQGLGQKGTGLFDVGKLDGNGDDYNMAFAGMSENFINLPGPAGLPTTYDFWGGVGESVFVMAQEKERRQDFVCHAIDAEDVLNFHFPKGVHVVALPRNTNVSDANFTYRADYSHKGNGVVVRRSLSFRHDGPVCTPADYRRMQGTLDRMMRDLRSQVVVQGP